jgi:putative ABC transport system ATP-binding protein
MMETIRAVGLTKTYGQGELAITALDDVSITVESGEVAALLGPSGSGKSTLLTALGLISLPDRGDLWLEGKPVLRDGQPLGDLAKVRRERIGFVFQKSNLIPFLTAGENVMLALEINDRTGRAARSRAAELLTYLELGARMDHYPDELSGGQQQRVAIARALATSPAMILADEPTAALDSIRGRSVMELLRRVAREQHAAVVVVTHDHRTLDVFDTIHEMADGRFVAPTATAHTVSAAPAPNP